MIVEAYTLAKVIKGGSLAIFPKLYAKWDKNEWNIYIDKEENVDEVEQKSLLTTCITKLHRYYRVILDARFVGFSPKKIL